MPLERNDAVKADAAYVKEQCTALPAMAAQADANVAAAAPARSSLRWFLGIVWEAARGRRWTRVLFFLAFVTVSTFYFKDQRLAEEAKKQAAEAELPPAAVRATWVRLPESELAKLGLRFHSRGGGRGRPVLRDAYAAGHAAGGRFEYRPGIGEGRPSEAVG